MVMYKHLELKKPLRVLLALQSCLYSSANRFGRRGLACIQIRSFSLSRLYVGTRDFKGLQTSKAIQSKSEPLALRVF